MQNPAHRPIQNHSSWRQNFKSLSFFNVFRPKKYVFLVWLGASALIGIAQAQTQQESNYSSLTQPANNWVLLDPPPKPSGGSGVEPPAVREQVWTELKDFAGPETVAQFLRSDPVVPLEPVEVLTPSPQIGFNGVINSPVTGIPPDTHIAVGPGLDNAGRIIMVTNGHLQIWDKTGSTVAGPTLLNTVFGSNCFDPKVLYDQHSGRFFIVCLEGSTPNPGGTSNIHIAVSSNGPPNNLTSDWTFMVGSGLTNVGGYDTWSDYPGIGADSDSLFVTINLFDSGGWSRGMKIRVFNKASLISGSYIYVDIDYNSAVTSVSTTQPAHVYGTTDNGGFYLISRLNSSTYRIFNITGDPASPVAATSTHSWSGGTFPSDMGADQLGTTVDLDTLASRVMNAVYRNGHIWLCLTSDPDNDGETEVVWQDITTNGGYPTSPSVYQFGYIDGTGSTPWTYMPSINVNSSGDAAICYTQSSTSQYADVVYTVRLSSDTLGTFQSPVVARAGTGYYDSFSSGDPDRWGDYSGCVVDPTTDCFWIANEFAWSSAPADSAWATYIANFCSVLVLQPPVAEDVNVSTPLNTPVTITLEASDDGYPNPILTYIVTSLPSNGTLSDPCTEEDINSVPYTLVNNGNQVVYTPDFGYTEPDSFQFKANDGGTAPEGGDSNLATVSINVGEVTVEYQVGSSYDDVYAYGSTSQNLTTAYLKVGYNSSFGVPYYMSGLRFTNVNIPKDATIISVYLKIQSYSSTLTSSVYGKIQAEATDNAGDFSGGRYIAGLVKTSASVEWDHSASWSADTWYTSPDIAGVVQEVVNRPGWSANNSLAIFYSTRIASGGYRYFSSYDRDSAYAPKLEITYIDVAAETPVITSIPVEVATVNQLYTYDVDANGIPEPNYALIASPSGMDINSVTGLIEWTPTDQQIGPNTPVTVRATNSEGFDEQSFTITVLPSDNFDDNKRSAMWRLFIEDYDNTWVIEDVNRLNVRATGDVNNLDASYVANGWSFDVNENFSLEVDFHYSGRSIRQGGIGITIENDDNYVLISAGSDSNESYFYYETIVDGNSVFEQEQRDSNDGTLYISYVADTNNVYLSHLGYGDANAYNWQTTPDPIHGQWASRAVQVIIGGESDGVVLGPNEAYLDNFKIIRGKLIGWPPATDLDGDGFIGWGDVEIMSEFWLDDPNTDPNVKGDMNSDDIVNFLDFAEFGLAW